MKQRFATIWLALLTVYLSFVTTDMYTTLRSVECCEGNTLQYMKKAAVILKRIKHAKFAPVDDSSAPADRAADTGDRPGASRHHKMETAGPDVANAGELAEH